MNLFIETADDEVIQDRSPSFSSGMISNARASIIPQDALVSLQNADVSITGKILTRKGSVSIGVNFTNPVQGLAFFSTITLSQLCAVRNGYFRHWNGTAWVAPAVDTQRWDATLPVQMVQGLATIATVTTFVLFISQEGTVLYAWDGTTLYDVKAGVGALNAPDKPAFCEWHTDRLVLAGMPTLPDTLSLSQFLDGGTYDVNNWYTRVGAGDGDFITGIRSWTKFDLLVFKQHSLWHINCDPILADPTTGNISGFQVMPIHKRIGCMAPNSAVQVGADVFFLSDSGVRSVARTLASESQTQVGPALSDNIGDLVERINPAAIHTSTAFFWNARYLLSVPLDLAIYPNYTLVYNTLTQSWTGFWTGWQPTAYARRVDGDTEKMVFGQADGSVTDFLDFLPEPAELDSTFQDQGVDYPTDVLSRAFTCSDEDSPKTGLYSRQEFLRSTSHAVTVSAILDGDDPIPLATFDTAIQGLMLPFTLPAVLPRGGVLPKSQSLLSKGQWREIQINVHSDAGKMSLNKISVGAFMDTFQLAELQ